MNRIGHLRLRYTVAILSCGLSLGARTELAWSSPRPAPIPSAVTTCATCNSLATLQAAALAYFNQWHDKTPPGYPVVGQSIVPEIMGDNEDTILDLLTGTKVTVISGTYPIAADFHFTTSTLGHTITWNAVPISATDDTGTRGFDNLIMARASRMPPINIPSNLTPSEEPELISAYVQSVVIAAGAPTMNFWHGLTNFGQFVSLTLVDLQNGKSYQVYVGDTITVKYADGSTEKFQYLGPQGGSVQWSRVPGSLRDPSGKDPTRPVTQTPVTGAGTSVSWSFDSSGNDGSTIVFYPGSGSSPAGFITIEELPDTTTYGDWD